MEQIPSVELEFLLSQFLLTNGETNSLHRADIGSVLDVTLAIIGNFLDELQFARVVELKNIFRFEDALTIGLASVEIYFDFDSHIHSAY